MFSNVTVMRISNVSLGDFFRPNELSLHNHQDELISQEPENADHDHGGNDNVHAHELVGIPQCLAKAFSHREHLSQNQNEPSVRRTDTNDTANAMQSVTQHDRRQ